MTTDERVDVVRRWIEQLVVAAFEHELIQLANGTNPIVRIGGPSGAPIIRYLLGVEAEFDGARRATRRSGDAARGCGRARSSSQKRCRASAVSDAAGVAATDAEIVSIGERTRTASDGVRFDVCAFRAAAAREQGAATRR